MVEGLVEEYEEIDEIRRTSSKFAITTIKEDASIGMIRDYEKEVLLSGL